MKTRKVRTTQEVIKEFDRKGISISSWAKEHGFPVSSVVQVLNGRRQGRRGQGHKIAVLLGIKDGEIVEACSNLGAPRPEHGRNFSDEAPALEKQSSVNGLR